jgi:hypothetical protein
MENTQEMGNQTAETSRRKFLTDSAKKAAWAAPALTLMMAASSTPARAAQKYGGTSTGTGTSTSTSTKPSGYQFWKVWHRVHRGRSI